MSEDRARREIYQKLTAKMSDKLLDQSSVTWRNMVEIQAALLDKLRDLTARLGEFRGGHGHRDQIPRNLAAARACIQPAR